MNFKMSHDTNKFFFNIFSISAEQYDNKGSLMNKMVIL